jgi:hypothetical protein
MGMFDTITINAAMLPVTEKDRQRLEGHHFQTKSLDESLQHYRITNDGMLETDWDMLWWRLNNSSWGKPRTEELVPPEENWEVVKITDSIRFYTHTEDDGEFFEFVAFFELGKMLIIRKLIGIDTVKNKITRKHKT